MGPIYRSDPQPDVTLASAYRNSLKLALEHDCKSIAFPAISCGVYGFPLERAAEIAVKLCSEEMYNSLDIKFYLFSAELFELWVRRLERTN